MAAIAASSLLVPLSTWFYAVTQTVQEPYLDEVFHVRQAQHYCNGRFDIWDPKITTPPGLYLLSYLGSLVPGIGCSITALRALNVLGIVLLSLVVRRSYLQRATDRGQRHSGVFDHSSLDVALFPTLFFFSALYYTDIWSTLLVVLFYTQISSTNHNNSGRLVHHVTLVTLGLASLAFRQTNIFWVAIFPAAITTIRQLDRGHDAVRNSMYRGVAGFGDSWYSIMKTSYKMQVVYDPAIRYASFDVYLVTIGSTVACALGMLSQPKKLFNLLLVLAPYLTLLGVFTGFVLWNGSVVLGDKSNHTATLHLPQMLYIWPFITFFSWPLVYPYLLLTPVSIISWLPISVGTLESMQIFKRGNLLPRPWLVLAAIGIACVVIYANTIVHPFTLADNRHYVFYAFRLLLWPWWMRYAASPLYILCAWACIQTLGGGPAKALVRAGSGEGEGLFLPDSQHSAPVSFALIWMATSALQLVTAPLVEPRYFILPWIFWRIHLPLRLRPQGTTPIKPDESLPSPKVLWNEYDHRLWLETAWLLIVNAATGYIFLYWGFTWPQEPGKVQRFMW
ncbi:glucosyltransferase [Recurvomyces mirabilis]|uniref:Dol-P-Glc:Glc(2)Man(9)GlcNAc(2)-PP-Dol alpha-1,2-glucosyltransferase n=1 Tax=Recurvomyces mirabilis TaxID=574656 RepID=A0AAE0WL34_9PEZI|nr:glucosyltransferase [Recurvomyces mirabilis]KAK5152153.1 glucosyltransferase [Recurvomyces mirabilis]